MTQHSVQYSAADLLLSYIQDCASSKFTGKLIVNHRLGPQQWELYFYLGRLFCGDSNVHPNRRWCRQISKYCPDIPLIDLWRIVGESLEGVLSYQIISRLITANLASRTQAARGIEGSLREVLFDIMQHGELIDDGSVDTRLQYSRHPLDDDKAPPKLFEAETIWRKERKSWDCWKTAGLTKTLPNLAPQARSLRILRRYAQSVAFRNLRGLATGEYTLRDVGIKVGQQPLAVAKALSPYMNKGLICLIEVGDYRNPQISTVTTRQQMFAKTYTTRTRPSTA